MQPERAESMAQGAESTAARAARRLAPGVQVTVYEDPISRTTPEGIAVLIEHGDGCRIEGTGHERWMVRFGAESETYLRLIHPADVVAGNVHRNDATAQRGEVAT